MKYHPDKNNGDRKKKKCWKMYILAKELDNLVLPYWLPYSS